MPGFTNFYQQWTEGQEIRRNGYIYSKKFVLYASFNDEMWHLGNEHTKINN